MSGSDLAILFTDSIIAVIRDFERVVKGHVGLNDVSILVSLLPSDISPAPATYLAFTNGKMAVASVCNGLASGGPRLLIYQQYSGIYVIALDGLENMSSHHAVDRTTGIHPSIPNLAISAAFRFESKSVLQSPSCLQVTDTAVWFTWNHYGRGHGNSMFA